MKKILKSFRSIIIIYLVLQIITINNYSKNLTIGFPFSVYGKIDSDCYMEVYIHPEFLIINFIIITIATILIYFIARLIKSKLSH